MSEERSKNPKVRIVRVLLKETAPISNKDLAAKAETSTGTIRGKHLAPLVEKGYVKSFKEDHHMMNEKTARTKDYEKDIEKVRPKPKEKVIVKPEKKKIVPKTTRKRVQKSKEVRDARTSLIKIIETIPARKQDYELFINPDTNKPFGSVVINGAKISGSKVWRQKLIDYVFILYDQ